MKNLVNTDNVAISFGICHTKASAMSYYDAKVCVNGVTYFVSYVYGINPQRDENIIRSVLKRAGFLLSSFNFDKLCLFTADVKYNTLIIEGTSCN